MQLSFSFGIFRFVCVLLPPILVEVLVSLFAVAIWLSFGFLGILCSFVLFYLPIWLRCWLRILG